MSAQVYWVFALLFATAIAQRVPLEVAEVLELLNQEPQDMESGSYSSEGTCIDSNNPLPYVRWVTYHRATEVNTVAVDYSVQEVIDWIHKDPNDRPASSSSEPDQDTTVEQMYELIHYNMEDANMEIEQRELYLSALNSSVYPGYAIGLLTNEECTAFLVGPHHAITTAECVYDHVNREWRKDGLDLWLARDCNTIVTKLLWSSVRIPYQYYYHNNLQHNWAYIEFEPTTLSKTWLAIAYDSTLYYRFGPVTIGGYSQKKPLGCPFSMQCLTKEVERNSCLLNVACNVPLSFPGAPVVAADFIAHQTMTPPVYGVSVGNNTSIRFTKHMFWSVCTWMKQSGHDAGCQYEHYFSLETAPLSG